MKKTITKIYQKVNKTILLYQDKKDISQDLQLIKDDLYNLYYDIEEDILRSKGDYIKEVIKLDTSIKEIDSAIPLYVANELRRLNIKVDNFCQVYFKNGTNETIDIVSHYCILKNNK